MLISNKIYFQMMLLIAVSAMTAQAEDWVTYSWSGVILKDPSHSTDPWGIGTGKPFTLSVTLLSGEQDISPTYVNPAAYLYKSADLTIDGVTSSYENVDYRLMAFYTNLNTSSVVSDALNMNGFFDFNGVSVQIASTIWVPLDTWSPSSSDSQVPILDDGTTSLDRYQHSGSPYISFVPAGTPFTVTVVPLSVNQGIEVLAERVAEVNLANGLSNSLDEKLSNAVDAWVSENFDSRQDVAHKLEAFINSVEAQRGKKISDRDAHHLVNTALDIIEQVVLESQ